MNNRLWLFFPENDIALAHGNANFTAPPAAVAMRRSGEMLPLWMSSPGNRILCSGVNGNWFDSIRRSFGIDADVWDHADSNLIPTPWGWSAASRKSFITAGFPEINLPDNPTIDRYRELSHRRTSARLSHIVSKYINLWPSAIEISDVNSLVDFINKNGAAVVKAPWSSSGRGVVFIDHTPSDDILRRVAGTIRRQGSVMVERFANDRYDFAMLFMCHKGSVEFTGISLFETANSSGQYLGNIVDSQNMLLSQLSEKIGHDLVIKLEAALSKAIEEIIAPYYDGPVGIDLLATEQNGRKMVHIVESNLRWTMGFLAKDLAKFVVGRSVFKVIKGDITDKCQNRIINGRLAQGKLSLTPPGGDFTFILETNSIN